MRFGDHEKNGRDPPLAQGHVAMGFEARAVGNLLAAS